MLSHRILDHTDDEPHSNNLHRDIIWNTEQALHATRSVSEPQQHQAPQAAIVDTTLKMSAVMKSTWIPNVFTLPSVAL